jgi:hypothetical protein
MNRQWWKAAGIRAAKTFAQTAVAFFAVGMGLFELDWLTVLSVSAVSAIASILTSIAGLPEVALPEVEDDEPII